MLIIGLDYIDNFVIIIMDRLAEKLEIITKIKKEEFSYSDHGNIRALERSLPVSEIVHIAKHLIRWEWQENIKTHLFIGPLTNGKGGGFSAVIRDDVIIVTVFRRKIKKWEKSDE